MKIGEVTMNGEIMSGAAGMTPMVARITRLQSR